MTTPSASASLSLQAVTVIWSPWPSSDHSFLSNSFSLWAMTLLAAFRMRTVDR
jgi:hypothetical protein